VVKNYYCKLEDITMTPPKEYPRGRKRTLAFYAIELLICVPAAIIHGITWPLCALSGGVFLFYCGFTTWENIAVLLGKINTFNANPQYTEKTDY
jgi:hypothetical protein